MKKKQNIPSAFDDVMSGLGYDNPEGAASITNMDQQDTFVDVEPPKNEPGPAQEPVEEKKDDEPVKTSTNDETDIPKEVLARMNGQKVDNEPDSIDDNADNEPTNAEVIEAEQVGALFDAIGEQFGWDMNQIEEDTRPVTVEGLTDYIRQVVDQNSVPEYADERIQALDAYVKNGGRFEDFYAAQQQAVNYDNINLEDENNQRTVIRDLLKANGYTDEQINNKIDRYESADMLEEEAEDALSRLKVIKQQETERLQQQQEAAMKRQQEETKAFYDTMYKDISGLTNIRGINIPKEDRKQLFDYIFKQDADGLTQYQKDFNANMVNNLIESAYFTMKGDTLLGNAKKNGQTSAANKLRTMLRHQAKNHSSYNVGDERKPQAWEIASRYL